MYIKTHDKTQREQSPELVVDVIASNGSQRRVRRKFTLRLFLIVLFLSMSLFTTKADGGGIPTYSVSPATQQINLDQPIQLSVSLRGGRSDTAYIFRVTVTLPDGTSTSNAQYSLITDASGSGVGLLRYPADFTPGTATPATNQTGIYQIRVDQSQPQFKYRVATSSFGVTSILSLSITNPVDGSTFPRGSAISLSVLVSDVNGNPYSSSNVSASPPGGAGTLSLVRGSQAGSYAGSYLIKWSDTTGPWTISYVASDSLGDIGQSSVQVAITAGTVVLQQLTAIDSGAQPKTSFYNNETINFQVDAIYTDGSHVASGATSIELLDPMGRVVITLAAVYASVAGKYVTITGFSFGSNSTLGTWTAMVPVNGLDDGFGNKGPSTPIMTHFTLSSPPVSTGTSQNAQENLGPVDYVSGTLLGLGSLVPVYALRRRERRRNDDIDKLVALARKAGFTIIEGEKQTGKSTVIYEAINQHAKLREPCILLTFETPPTEVRTRFGQRGINADRLEESGVLNIIDCSHVSQSLSLGFIRSELFSALEGRIHSFAVIFDSLNLLFDDLDEGEVIELLTSLRAGIVDKNGIVYATVSTARLSSALISTLESKAGFVLQLERMPYDKAMKIALNTKKAPWGGDETIGRRLLISARIPPSFQADS